jgi:hypothetical protein
VVELLLENEANPDLGYYGRPLKPYDVADANQFHRFGTRSQI